MLPFLTRVFDVDPVKCVYKAKKYRYLSNVALANLSLRVSHDLYDTLCVLVSVYLVT